MNRLFYILILVLTLAYLFFLEANFTGAHEPEYERGLYKHWSDLNFDGFSTRQEVLGDESIVMPVFDGDRLISGRWICPFSKEEFDNPTKLDIDHLVPLKEAHLSGAWRWNRVQREEYANYQGDPDHLVAVKASENRSKGARDPAAWLPGSDPCKYSIAWVRTKIRWELEFDEQEVEAILEAIATCPPQYRSRSHGN